MKVLVAVVIEAVLRIGKKALKHPILYAYAALAFFAIFLKKNHRIEVLGLVLLISLLIWRLMEHCIAPLYHRYRQYYYRLEGQADNQTNLFYDGNQVS